MEDPSVYTDLPQRRFTVVICASEPIPAELVFLAVQDAIGPGGRLAGFDIEYCDAESEG